MLPVNYTNDYALIPMDNIYPIDGIITSMVFTLFFVGSYIAYYVSMGIFIQRITKDGSEVSKKAKAIVISTLLIVSFQLSSQIFKFISDILYLIIDTKPIVDGQYQVSVDLYNSAVAIEFIANIISWSVPIAMVVLLCYVQLLFWDTICMLHLISKKTRNIITGIYSSILIVICLIWISLDLWGCADSIYIRTEPFMFAYISYIYSILVTVVIFTFLMTLFVMGLIPGLVLLSGIMKNKSTLTPSDKSPVLVTLFLLMGMLFSIFIYNIGIPISLIFAVVSQSNGMNAGLSGSITVILLNIFINVAVLSFSVFSMCLFYPMLKTKSIMKPVTTELKDATTQPVTPRIQV